MFDNKGIPTVAHAATSATISCQNRTTHGYSHKGFQWCENGGDPDYLETVEGIIRRSPYNTGDWIPYPRLSSGDVPDDSEYDRATLIDLCDRAIVQQQDWENRDTANTHKSLGAVWAMLQAGCNYRVRRNSDDAPCITDDETVWIVIYHPDEDSHQSTTAFLPTEKRLHQYNGRDWY